MIINRKKIALVAAVWGMALFSADAQETKTDRPARKPVNVGISYNLHAFDTIRLGKIKDSAYGFSVMFWKGISPHIDYSVRANAVFPNKNKNNIISKNPVSGELELAIHAKAFKDQAVLNPFLTLGIGGGYYHKDLAKSVPPYETYTWNGHALGGGGLQLNIKSELYFLLQLHYRYSFNESRLPHNLFYSFGITKSITKKKTPPPPVIADRDNDGVPDNADACPDVAGPAALQGCPDRDGDGIADKDDACPDAKGPAEFKGCPDRDGDGITDKEDKCPDEKGVARYDGCPVPDTDKDGINDEDDRCPTVAGVIRYKGCPVPDSDNDGINDEEDKCPNLAGVRENQGCPAISEEVKKRVSKAAQNILFVTGSAKLQKSSNKGLDEVAKILLENPEMELQIDGHTDNVGSEEMNQTLSDNRAATVRNYFISKGISESRITAAGHGELEPIADNKTAAGRTKNRRVELVLSYFQ
ncbi:MAG: OmpA family protein [Chitinophagaceae bacterium]|nr:OmpA family protein [Chitinophagaceae bacterium]